MNFLFFFSASVMSGKSADLQTIMREKYMSKGVYIHCCTHRLNLVIVDVCKVVNCIGEFYSIMSSIYSFFTCSGVANEHFLDAQQKLNLGKYIFSFIAYFACRHFLF